MCIDDEVRYILDQHAELDFYSASSLKKQSADRQCRPTRIHYPDSEPTSLLFLLNAAFLKEKQFNHLIFIHVHTSLISINY
jgi:hypothetical protein